MSFVAKLLSVFVRKQALSIIHPLSAPANGISFLTSSSTNHAAFLVSSAGRTRLLSTKPLLGSMGPCVRLAYGARPAENVWLRSPFAAGEQRRTLLLMPRRFKFRKMFKRVGFKETVAPNTRQLAYGLYGIRAITSGRIPARTLEAVRRTLRRSVRKTTKIWIRVAAGIPVTSKPLEVRMGKGKGAVDHYIANVRPGQILFELDRVPRSVALQALRSVSFKLPVRVGFVEWN